MSVRKAEPLLLLDQATRLFDQPQVRGVERPRLDQCRIRRRLCLGQGNLQHGQLRAPLGGVAIAAGPRVLGEPSATGAASASWHYRVRRARTR